ncbi:hypothetical protein THRCLA_23027 [Thraustotheca clavata]|uniref:Uncharacterized protein n=1 Tax=Thraustotheca clavata TaxID=74557 RepID=A0A1V9YIE6_9STRA|nr:hypothetical protein THRCLA_23027 [Thraustotheca clavata]
MTRPKNDLFSFFEKSKAMDIAAAPGDFDTVKLIHRIGIKCCTARAMNKAAGFGRLGIGCTNDAITYAAARGHLNVVKWLHEVKILFCTMDGLSTAAYNGDIEMVKYLITIPMPYENYPLVATLMVGGK